MNTIKQPVAQVVLGNTTRTYDKIYDYCVPDKFNDIRPGMRVIVPFGRSNVPKEAWVIQLKASDASMKEKQYKLKDILDQIDLSPILSEEHIKLAAWMRDRFFCTWHQAISVMLPSGIRLVQSKTVRLSDAFRARLLKNRDVDELASSMADYFLEESHDFALSRVSAEHPDWMPLLQHWLQTGLAICEVTYEQKSRRKTERAAVSLIEADSYEALMAAHKIKSHPQQLVMQMLLEEEFVIVTDLYMLPGVGNAVLKAMEKKGWLLFTEISSERDPFKNLIVRETQPMLPTDEQEKAFQRLSAMISDDGPSEALVHGVTGSGKTELYLRLIDLALCRGNGCILMVPEISLTPQMVERFRGRFGQRIAVQHSRLSVGERMDQWNRIQTGELDVVIGARSAVFAPVRRLGMIIIDEEHEPAYKSESVPRYDARLVARARINLCKGVLISGSATPSLETMYRAKNESIHLVRLKNRVLNRPMPSIELVDMRKELAEGVRGIFSQKLQAYMEENKQSGEQTILFLNRRGFATFLLCRDCGYALKCPSCQIALTMHQSGRAICHYCGFMSPIPKTCPDCHGDHLKAYGAGTQRLEADLKSGTEGYRVIRMDLDTTSGKNGHALLLDAFRNREADILVGTQMVAKGHDFPEVTLVGIMAADAMLFTGDFRAGERTFQLVTQAAGRAGRAEKPGRVVVQAYSIDEYALTAALNHDYEAFYQREIALRKQLFYPPLCHMGLVRLQGLEESAVVEQMEIVAAALNKLLTSSGTPGEFVSSPHGKAPFARIADRYRYRLIVRHVSAARLCKLFHELANTVWKSCNDAGVDLNLDIDPVSML